MDFFTLLHSREKEVKRQQILKQRYEDKPDEIQEYDLKEMRKLYKEKSIDLDRVKEKPIKKKKKVLRLLPKKLNQKEKKEEEELKKVLDPPVTSLDSKIKEFEKK